MPGSSCLRDYRLRRDQPDLERDRAGHLRTKQKYLSPPGRGNMLYIPPAVDDGLLKNVAVPLLITEGEFKTLALWRLANWSSERPRLFRSALRGCSTGREPSAKRADPPGSR
jgi:hypothetical protein